MIRRITCALIVLGLAGCSTIPMDETKPVEYRNTFGDVGFYQNGKFLIQEDAIAKITKNPAAADEVHTAKIWWWSGFGVSTVGLVLALGTSTSSDFNSAQYWTGMGLILAGIPIDYIGRTHLEKATDLYNRDFTTPVKRPAVQLFLSPVKDGGLAGLAYSF